MRGSGKKDIKAQCEILAADMLEKCRKSFSSLEGDKMSVADICRVLPVALKLSQFADGVLQVPEGETCGKGIDLGRLTDEELALMEKLLARASEGEE